MIRLRTSLLLLAITALLLSGMPVFAAGDSGLPSWIIAAPATSPGLDAGRCPDPGTSVTVGTPAVLELAAPPDFILCSCDLCKDHPDVVCRISPSGYSIVCADYYRLHCNG
jgi:hypothetical protein